jgi:hypothetical protein
VGNGRRPPLVEPPDGRHALYLRLEARCGVETLSEFFALLRLETQVGGSPAKAVQKAVCISYPLTVINWGMRRPGVGPFPFRCFNIPNM